MGHQKSTSCRTAYRDKRSEKVEQVQKRIHEHVLITDEDLQDIIENELKITDWDGPRLPPDLIHAMWRDAAARHWQIHALGVEKGQPKDQLARYLGR